MTPAVRRPWSVRFWSYLPWGKKLSKEGPRSSSRLELARSAYKACRIALPEPVRVCTWTSQVDPEGLAPDMASGSLRSSGAAQKLGDDLAGLLAALGGNSL